MSVHSLRIGKIHSVLRNVWFGFEIIEMNLILLRRTDIVNKKNELIMCVWELTLSVTTSRRRCQ